MSICRLAALNQAVVDFFQKLCRAAVLLEKEMPDVQLAAWLGILEPLATKSSPPAATCVW